MKRKSSENYVSYSDVLIRFIEPILTGEEDEIEFLEKAKAGMTAWNFSVSGHVGLHADQMITEITADYYRNAPYWLKEIMDKLVIRKNTEFAQFNQYLITLEARKKPDGTPTLYVESIPADILKSIGG